MAEAKKENFFARTGKRLSRWFREMKSELKKVVWPTKSQMVNNTDDTGYRNRRWSCNHPVKR